MPKYLFYVSILSLLSACVSTGKFSGGASFYDSAYNDHNEAPAHMRPPSYKSGEDEKLDPAYMRTQADYYFQVGEAYSLDGNHQKAIEAFKMVMIYDAESAVVHLRLAGEYIKLGQMSLAMEHAELAVAKDSKSIDARVLLGGIYSSLKVYDKALVQYETILKIDSDNMDAPLYIGALYAEKKDYDQAAKYFTTLAKNEDNPAPQVAWYYIGRIRSEQKSKNSDKLAEEAFKKAISIKADYVEAVIGLGNLYSKNKQDSKVVELYKSFQREHGPHPRLAEFLVQTYLEQEKLDLAYEQLEALEGYTDDSLNVRMRMALILIEQKQYSKAISKLNEILVQVPDSDKIRFYLAAIYEETQQYSKAVENFLRITPESQYYGESVVHAAYLLKQSKNSDEAISIVKEGLKYRQDVAQFYTIYASLMDEKGQWLQAKDILEDAAKKFPDNIQVQFFLGTILDRVGDKEKVIKQMKKVVEMDPNHVQGLNYLAFTYAESTNDLEEAEKLVRRAIAIEPNDGYILDTLGWILFKKGSMQESIKVLEAAYRIQPNEAIIAEHLGDAYTKHQLVEKARVMYKKAAETETDVKKVREIKEKISALDRQEFKNYERSPASLNGENK